MRRKTKENKEKIGEDHEVLPPCQSKVHPRKSIIVVVLDAQELLLTVPHEIGTPVGIAITIRTDA